MLVPKIAEVKYTLIGLQDICIGQTSGDWLLRDKKVCGFRKYGPDKCLEWPPNYSVQRPKESLQNIMPCLLHVINGCRSRTEVAKEFAKQTID